MSNAWIPFCPSDLSEIPADKYDEYWLGTYYCCDINKDGIDELVIKAGQSIADMSMTFFTYTDDGVMHLGSLNTGDAFFYNLTTEAGCIICEQHGGMGVDTYVDLINMELSIYDQRDYNYEQPGYYDEKQGISYAVQGYNVHDYSGL